MEPNNEQRKLIDSTEGVYLVDAGAGTGKTFSLTRRYSSILEDSDPEDILLATFTNNAASQMKERIIEMNPERAEEIEDAPVMTFHSLSRDILRERGVDAPRLIGIDESIPGDMDLIESRVRELEEFERFFDGFQSRHPEHEQFTRIIDEDSELLDLLKNISARGIIPEEDGWFGRSEEYLDGDFEEFKELFRKKNRPRKTDNGKKQSRLRERLYSYKYRLLPEESPDADIIRGDRGTKKVRMDFARKAFEQDREELKMFVHDLYIEYLRYCLQKGYLNFGFLLVLAFILLYKDRETRKELEFDHVMIDEFQDTNEIQFKLSLLLSGEKNLCVVGDWKQSIYGFQHASVENITEFSERLSNYTEELNSDRVRSPFTKFDVEKIHLYRNYRSGQDILDTAEQALELEATKSEVLETPPDTVSLESQTDFDGKARKMLCESEAEAITGEIGELLEEEFDPGDIAVLVRSRKTGFEIHDELKQRGFPVIYEGGVKLFETDPSLMLLAWLRVLRGDSKGYATVLEREGYSIKEAEDFVGEEELPEELSNFRRSAAKVESVGELAAMVFDRYGMWGPEADRVIDVLENTYENSYLDLEQITDFIVDNIESEEVYEIEADDEGSSIRIQTIHGAKGLEYPVVFMAGVKTSVFPSTQSSNLPVDYQEPVGLRTRKSFVDGEYPYSYDSWRSEILFKTLDTDMDEERRLFYVAMTRAERRLYITSEKGRESPFFEGLDVETIEAPSPGTYQGSDEERKTFGIGRADERPSIFNPSPERITGTISEDYHRFAEDFIDSGAVPEDEIEERIVEFIRGLDGDLRPEVDVIMPLGEDAVQGRIDLMVEKDDCVDLYDYKLGERESDIQVSSYHHAVADSTGKEVTSHIFRLDTGELDTIEPLSKEEIKDRL